MASPACCHALPFERPKASSGAEACGRSWIKPWSRVAVAAAPSFLGFLHPTHQPADGTDAGVVRGRPEPPPTAGFGRHCPPGPRTICVPSAVACTHCS